ncbi:hypothetical protein Hanom_Chr12g01170391 [Helianthus anomalus]
MFYISPFPDNTCILLCVCMYVCMLHRVVCNIGFFVHAAAGFTIQFTSRVAVASIGLTLTHPTL